MATLKEKFAEKVAPARTEVKSIMKEHGAKVISEVTIAQAYGGARGVKCMVTETSALDPMEGIRFRGYNIPELREKLPKAPGGEEPLPEAMFYLMLLGELPTADDVAEITKTWRGNETLPQYVIDMLEALPATTHPMTQFSNGILALQNESNFAREYAAGIPKTEYWSPMYDDVINLLGKLPLIAAYIYRRTYKEGNHIAADANLDWGGNFAHMMGVENPQYKELMRLYLMLHCDHEGGNVSAHTTHLVGSTLSDAFYAAIRASA